MTNTQQPKRSPLQGARAVALWARDSGLGGFGFALVLAVALSGWSASFIGLHDFGIHHMGLSPNAAWLVPATFDGAPAGLSIVVMRAGIHGRSALLWRLLIVGFTLLSSWINYEHINDPVGRIVASFMPPSAVILFEGLMSEVRAAAHRRDGRQVRPRLHPLRFFFDWDGTVGIMRSYVLGLPLPEALSVALAETPSERPVRAAHGAPESAPPPAMEAPRERPEYPLQSATQSAPDAPASATESVYVAPQARPESAATTATKAPRKALPKTPSERPRKDIRGAARDAIKALYGELGKRPLESEMIAALKKAKLPHSRQFANARRLEIEKAHPELAAMGSTNVHPLTGTDS